MARVLARAAGRKSVSGVRELRAVGLDRQTAQDKGGRDLADQPDVRG